MNFSKKATVTVLSVALIATGLAGCGGKSKTDSSKGHVYFLNGKTEVADQFKALAKKYTEKTGVEVQISTSSAEEMDETMASELAKSEPPTMFSISGYDDFTKYKSHMAPLQDTEVFSLLNDAGKTNAYRDGKNAYTLPYAAEWYGIIYNKKIIKDYCSKPYAVIKSDADIKNWDVFTKVVKDIQSHKGDLGIKGAFATPGLDASAQYRFTAHLSRIPLFFEYKDSNTTFKPELKGTYLDNYKNMIDLQVQNSPTPATMLSSKTSDDIAGEFALGEVAFYTNGVWSYTNIRKNKVADSDIGMLPSYFTGIKGEEAYAPPSIYDAAWAVNKNINAADRKATLDFIKWMVNSDQGKSVLSKEMGFSVPFKGFDNAKYQPDNPITTAARQWETKGKKPLRSFAIPGMQWEDGIGNALVEYTQGTKGWDNVKSTYLNVWKSEWADNQKATGMLPKATKFED
ncbi:ABC transporter substrate-binding protein [Bifidobacterium sp. ESL0784]|uniref:ABC transporter substrate-binding protein n=1 Tax=Bifidobacterium sp. ESL0784 TaxID=2983231 RepID=UPI0023FA08B9|nr:ABC transporter substrate-binding protein [Bifidobacterium sp. ESL0784]MDF7640798.1 ABC transporter substrate-binding protein [Bifidobacterium sp. ESL0784]